METSLRTGFAQIFSRCPKNLSCPKFGGAAAPLAPPARTPMDGTFTIYKKILIILFNLFHLFDKLRWSQQISWLQMYGFP